MCYLPKRLFNTQYYISLKHTLIMQCATPKAALNINYMSEIKTYHFKDLTEFHL